MREWLTAPAGLLEDICELRAYARAKTLYEQAQHWEDGPGKRKVMADPLVRLVVEHDFAPLMERQKRDAAGE